MDMDEHREVSFKAAEQLAYVSHCKVGGWFYFERRVTHVVVTPCTGKQGDVLRGQRLHQQERDRGPDASGQVRSAT